MSKCSYCKRRKASHEVKINGHYTLVCDVCLVKIANAIFEPTYRMNLRGEIVDVIELFKVQALARRLARRIFSKLEKAWWISSLGIKDFESGEEVKLNDRLLELVLMTNKQFYKAQRDIIPRALNL